MLSSNSPSENLKETIKIFDEPYIQLWRQAIKLPLYSVALIPVFVATAAVYADTKTIDIGNFLTFLLSIILIQIWINLSNDVFDADTGVDTHKFHSIVQLTGQKNMIFWLANAFVASGLLVVAPIAWQQQDMTLIVLMLLGCFLGYSYQGPPFRFSYQGIGEIICFISYGPLLMGTAYYAQTQTWSTTCLAASTIIGLATSLILFCAHFHQVEDDLAGGKLSPVVRLGTARSAQLLPWWQGSIYGLVCLFAALGLLPPFTLLSLLSLVYAVKLSFHVHRHHDQPDQVSNCKFVAVAMYFSLGLLLTLGLLLPPLF
ncbi:2-carboxy-1,4-naphthoquinone phytyltransferase [Leptothoe spongobia]|uniref:2-carboxy-1,4-naphthoquinone phytyltransferase n=1 Tax=Leptothoe spongobia TAU-MAC 1115 TaxID=1967444 RepID=A0A947DG69_9CYAN|nr:2-carboxy-1,4-naphthoquinone phytyltransferase [Leptothoe spongobia]MBT9315809.1 2-carboxy-1,4-naphthoquinone phytyltransferase [Leptothoe spongobia TAU-MAC 1115]